MKTFALVAIAGAANAFVSYEGLLSGDDFKFMNYIATNNKFY